MPLKNHSAAGANAGFTYQFDRAMDWLSKSPAGSLVGIETHDDVVLQLPDGTLTLEQDKHSISPDGRPFGDRSKDLWNTLATWLTAIEDSEIDVANSYFLMVTNKTLSPAIASELAAAKEPEDIQACIVRLEAAALNPPQGIAHLTNKVLALASRESLIKLIERIDLADGSAGPELRGQILSQLQIPEWCRPASDNIANELMGWMHRICMEFWSKNQPAWIERDHFINQLHAAIDQRKRRITRERSENLIEIEDENVGQARGRPFVKQIYLITEDDSVADSAIKDFIRCNIEKTRLSIEGNVTDDDWLAFESTLRSRWQRIRARVIRIPRGTTPQDVGFEIFTETTESHREKLAGLDTEQVYLTAGSYHRLADSLHVGWHPEYEISMADAPETDE